MGKFFCLWAEDTKIFPQKKEGGALTRTEKVLGYFAEKSYTPQTLEELVVTLDVKKENVAELSGILDELTQKGEIVKTKKKRYALTKKMNMVSGKLQGNQKGFGFVVPQEKKNGEQDLFIAAENMAGALHGDLVVAKVLPKTKNGKPRVKSLPF